VKAIAALSNNRGGYVLFGVADGGHKGAAGQDLSYAVVGLGTDEFNKVDPAEITNKLRSILDPTPRIEIATRQIGPTTIGVIHVEQHPSRPVIAQKSEGDKIKEGDIFYRYPGQSIRVKYSDLRAMLDQRDRQARLDVMPMVERLLALGPQRALVADLDRGVLDDGKNHITIAPELIDRIKFIREGAFDEVAGAPALKLVGDVLAEGAIHSRGVITDDIVIRNFLAGQLISTPMEYIRYAAIGGRAAWLPIGYFALRAGVTRSQVRAMIKALPGQSARKTTLLARIGKTDPARQDPQGAPKAILKDLMSGTVPKPTDLKSAQTIAQAITGLKSAGPLKLDDLLTLLGQCLAMIDGSGKAIAMSHIRRAACRLDELFFPLSE
jgi:CRP-like cAMP-binding protein